MPKRRRIEVKEFPNKVERDVTLIVEDQSLVLRSIPEPFASEFAIQLGEILSFQVVRIKMLLREQWQRGQVEVLRG